MINLNTDFFTVENNARTQINEVGGIASGDTTFTVDDASKFKVGMICTLSDKEYIQNSTITERIRITGIASNDLTVVRNIDGTGAETFVDNAWIQNANNAEPIAQLQDFIEKGWIEIRPNGGFEYDTAESIRTVNNIDLTDNYQVGDKLRYTQSSTIKYGIITEINYNSTVANRTYIKITGSSVANSSITLTAISRYVKPYKFPGVFYDGNIGSGLIGGRIEVSVASNNLTVAVKTLSGANPSILSPVVVYIPDINGYPVRRLITSALSVNANAGTSWFNSGSVELATYGIDYNVQLGFNSINGVTIGFSRLFHINTYGGYSTTSSNERFCKISTITNATANDSYVNVGRFRAVLSGGAFNWSGVSNVINRPIYETDELECVHNIVWTGGTTNPSTTTSIFKYKIRNDMIKINSWFFDGGSGAKNRTTATVTVPLAFQPTNSSRDLIRTLVYSGGGVVGIGGARLVTGNTFDVIVSMTTASFEMYTSGEYKI